MKNHQGMITVLSEQGEGSTFSLYFPISSDTDQFSDMVKQVVRPSMIDYSTKTILIVDDEKPVSNFLDSILTSKGVKTIVFNDPLEALLYFKKNSENIDLILSDIIMPNLDGRTMYAKMQEISSQVPVIFLSGYSNEQIKDLKHPLLLKPFQINTILDVITKTLLTT